MNCSTALMPTKSSTLVAVAAVLTGRRADPAHHGREGVGIGGAAEGVLLPGHAGRRLLLLAHDGEPAADVLTRGAAALAGRGLVDIGRTLVGVVPAKIFSGTDPTPGRRPRTAERMSRFRFRLVCGRCHVGLRVTFLVQARWRWTPWRLTICPCAVEGQDLGELALADGADGGHVRDALLLHHVVQGLHAGLGPLDPQLHQIVGQQPAAAAAAEGAIADGLLVHVVEVIADRRMMARGISNCPPGVSPMREARATLQES